MFRTPHATHRMIWTLRLGILALGTVPVVPAAADSGPIPIHGNGQAVRIDRPGSYVLAADLHAMAGQHGIEITVAGVTLDLNGFAIIGDDPGGSLNGIEIACPAGTGTVAIHNGTIRGFRGHGVSATRGTGVRIEYVRVLDTGLSGMAVGPGGVIRNCLGAQGASSPATAGLARRY